MSVAGSKLKKILCAHTQTPSDAIAAATDAKHRGRGTRDVSRESGQGRGRASPSHPSLFSTCKNNDARSGDTEWLLYLNVRIPLGVFVFFGVTMTRFTFCFLNGKNVNNHRTCVSEEA